MLYGCKGISIGYFSQPVEELLKKVIIGYEEGEKVEPVFGRESVKEWGSVGNLYVDLTLKIKEGCCVSLTNKESVWWFQVWPDGTISMTIAKDKTVALAEGVNNER